jgi:hypothetical protein
MATKNAAAAQDITAWGFEPGSNFDKWRVRYSPNRKTVIKAPCGTVRYEIAPGVKRIARYAFSTVNQLVEITIPASVVEIEEGAFQNTGISRLGIPAGVSKIPTALCAHCSSLTDIDLPHGITEIGAEAFLACKALRHVVIPSSVKTIKCSAFDGCDALLTCDIPRGCRLHKDAFPEKCRLMKPKEGFLFRSQQALEIFSDKEVGVVG